MDNMQKLKHPPLTPAQKQAIDALFIQNFGQLLDIAGDDQSMGPMQPTAIVEWVSRHLDLYPIEAKESTGFSDFLEWATAIVVPLRQMVALKNLYNKYVYHGIWRMIRGYTDLLDHQDLSLPPIERPLTTIDELHNLTWIWAFEHMAELSDPALTKSPSSRLEEKAYWITRSWVRDKLRERGYRPKKKDDQDAPVDTDGMPDTIQPDTEPMFLTFQEFAELRGEPQESEHPAPEPDDAQVLSEAINKVLAFKPKKRSKDSDSDMTDWGKPTVGSWLLCRHCIGHDLKRVARIGADGYTAYLDCGHSRTAATENNSLAA